MNILVIWKAFVEFYQISFLEFVLEEVTVAYILQIDYFHNLYLGLSQEVSFQ